MQKPPPKGLSFTQISRLAKARAKEYSLQQIFKLGYRNKEDVSNLPAYTLVVGSQNVLTNAAEQVGIRQGYVLDGAAGNQNTYGIDSSYDFQTKIGAIQNLRKWGTNMEVRYLNPNTKAVSWINIYNTLNASKICNFTNFWDLNTEVSMFALFVNGDNNVYEWSGGVASFASATSNTITVQGTNTLAQLGFYHASNAGKYNLLINGVKYTYTAAGSSPSTGYTETQTGATQTIAPNSWVSQLFTTGGTSTQIISISTIFNTVTTTFTAPLNFTMYIYTDNAGVPGTIVATATTSLNASTTGPLTPPQTGLALTFNFNTPISSATNYHMVLSSTIASNVSTTTGTTGSVGTNISTNTGTSWSPINGYLYATVTENIVSQQTFVGVTPDPTGVTINAGDAVIQPVVLGVTAGGVKSQSSPQTMPTNFNFDLISTLSNQVWYGSLTSTSIFVSKTNNYQDVTFSSPQRLPAEGAFLNLDSPAVGFSPQGTKMYVSSGLSQWWLSNIFQQTVVVSGVSTATETIYLDRLKTATGQGAQSQAFIGRFKNALTFVSNEPIFNSLGLVTNIQLDPQVVNMSDPIKFDMANYNFTGGQTFYFNYFIYITIPQMGVVRIYNVNKLYWEAPQLLPISRFYVVNNQLYGHDSNTNQSYQMFTGYNDNGNPINAVAAFAYTSQTGGSSPEKKNFNKHFTEGYISGNTSLTLTTNYDFGGFSGNYSVNILGSNSKIIFNKITDGSLGQNTLGTQPIGSILNLPNQPPNPKFRVVNTMPRTNCFEYQTIYSTNDIDCQWSLLRFGPSINASDDLPVEITE